MKRIALRSLALGLLVIIGYHGCIFLTMLISFGRPASWSYGEGRFTRFKRVAGRSECAQLVALLEEEKPKEFNRARKELGLQHRYLDLKSLDLAGEDLPGVDLSKCVLTGCNFSGCDLRGASFKGSYASETTFCGPLFVQRGAITPKMARTTDLSGSHFDGATLEGTIYVSIEFGYAPVKTRADLGFCNLSNSTGLAAFAPHANWDLPIRATPGGPQIAPKSGRTVTNIARVSTPCENPFQDIPDPALDQWSGMGVDLLKLRVMPACQLEPSRFAIGTQTIANLDPNLVVVITDSFNRWVDVASAGPLVAMNHAHGIRRFFSESTLWIRDEASFDDIGVGHPIVLSDVRRHPLGRALLSPAYVWASAGSEERMWMKRLLATKTIDNVARMIGHSARSYIQPNGQNPGLATLVGEARADRLLREHAELTTAPLAIASGQHFGVNSVDIIQTNPSVTLVLKEGFATHGGVFAAGPVVILRAAQADPFLSKSWIDGAEWRYHPAISLK